MSLTKIHVDMFSWGWLLDTNIRASTFLCVNIPDLFEEPSSARSSFYEAYGCGDYGRMAQGLLKLPMAPPELSSTLPPCLQRQWVESRLRVSSPAPSAMVTESRVTWDIGKKKEH